MLDMVNEILKFSNEIKRVQGAKNINKNFLTIIYSLPTESEIDTRSADSCLTDNEIDGKT